MDGQEQSFSLAQLLVTAVVTLLGGGSIGAGIFKVIEKWSDRRASREQGETNLIGTLVEASVGASEKVQGNLWKRLEKVEGDLEKMQTDLARVNAENGRLQARVEELEKTEALYLQLQENFKNVITEMARMFKGNGASPAQGGA